MHVYDFFQHFFKKNHIDTQRIVYSALPDVCRKVRVQMYYKLDFLSTFSSYRVLVWVLLMLIFTHQPRPHPGLPPGGGLQIVFFLQQPPTVAMRHKRHHHSDHSKVLCHIFIKKIHLKAQQPNWNKILKLCWIVFEL